MQLDIDLIFQNASPDIKFKLYLDGLLLTEMSSDGQRHLIHKYCDVDNHALIHRLCLTMDGKTSDHTKIGASGEIIWDCAIIIKSIKFNDIDITYLVCQGAECYHHNNNGATDSFLDEFFGYMGHNGEVIIEFESPLHVWFLKQCQ